jgi:small subunit ribosomal protein S17
MAEDEKEIPAEPESQDETETEDTAAAESAEQSVETDAVQEEAETAQKGDAPTEEAAPDGEAEPVDADASSASAEPKRKRKRLARPLRPQKTRPRRTAATATRKPVVREPKPERERGRRQERRGVVVSSAMDKTIVVKVEMIKSHPKYKKVVRRSVKFHVHDEQNVASVGDVVRIVETRPLSATKRWRLAEVLEAAK